MTDPEPAESAAAAPNPAARDTTRPAHDVVDVDRLTAEERAYCKDTELRDGRVDRANVKLRIERSRQSAIRAVGSGVVTDRFVMPDGRLTTASAAEVAGTHR